MLAHGRDPGPSCITTAGGLNRELPAWRSAGGAQRSGPPLRQQGCKLGGQSLERLWTLACCMRLRLAHLSLRGAAWVMSPRLCALLYSLQSSIVDSAELWRLVLRLQCYSALGSCAVRSLLARHLLRMDVGVAFMSGLLRW